MIRAGYALVTQRLILVASVLLILSDRFIIAYLSIAQLPAPSPRQLVVRLASFRAQFLQREDTAPVAHHGHTKRQRVPSVDHGVFEYVVKAESTGQHAFHGDWIDFSSWWRVDSLAPCPTHLEMFESITNRILYSRYYLELDTILTEITDSELFATSDISPVYMAVCYLLNPELKKSNPRDYLDLIKYKKRIRLM